MNYQVFSDTKNPTLITTFQRDPALKPVPGDIITIGDSLTPFVITREEIAVIVEFDRITEGGILRITEEGDFRVLEQSTPAAPDESFNFFVRVQNTSPDSVSLRKSNDNVQQKMNRFA